MNPQNQSARSVFIDAMCLITVCFLACFDKIDRPLTAILLLGFFQARGFVGAAGKFIAGQNSGGGGSGGSGTSQEMPAVKQVPETPKRDDSTFVKRSGSTWSAYRDVFHAATYVTAIRYVARGMRFPTASHGLLVTVLAILSVGACAATNEHDQHGTSSSVRSSPSISLRRLSTQSP